MKDKVKFIKLADINVGERFREDFGNLDELIESVKDKGIIQPLTIDSDMKLLAGGRRHRAATEAGLTEVPVLIRTTDGELDAREIELIENVHRKDFSWQERAKITARIHELTKKKHGLGAGRRTAELLDQSPMSVSRAVRLAEAIEILPDIAECKTADDAHKFLKKAEEQVILQEMAKRQKGFVETTTSNKDAKPKDKQLANLLHAANRNYILKDVFEGLQGLRTGGHLDFIECDPPYGVDLGKLSARKDKGTVLQSRDSNYNEIPKDSYREFLQKLCPELYRVAGSNCWMVFWFAFEWESEVFAELTAAGWHVDRVPALWIKGNGRTPRPDLLLARAYEPFFVCRKGNPTIVKQGRTNIFMRSVDDKKYHPAQRPVPLMKELIETFCDGMRHILVPFAGSGATLRAAYEVGHHVIGFDNNPEYKDQFLLAVEEDGKKWLTK